jgi:hypothetical protein
MEPHRVLVLVSLFCQTFIPGHFVLIGALFPDPDPNPSYHASADALSDYPSVPFLVDRAPSVGWKPESNGMLPASLGFLRRVYLIRSLALPLQLMSGYQ